MEEDAAPRPPLKGRRVSPSLHLSQSLKYRVGWGGGTEWAVGRFLPLLVAMPLRCVLCPHLSPQSKLVKYFSRQLSCKKKVALQERNAELDGFPQLRHWFRIVDVRKEVLEVTGGAPCPLPLTGQQTAPAAVGFWLCLAHSRPSINMYGMKARRISEAVEWGH